MEVMPGGMVTVNWVSPPPAAMPLAVTTLLPVVAPLGTETVMLVPVQV